MPLIACVPCINLYQKPDFSSPYVDELLLGMTSISLTSLNNSDWIKIRTFYGYEGYAQKNQFIYQKETNSSSLIVHSSFADVFLKPKLKSPRLLTLAKGSLLTNYHEYEKNWLHLYLPDQTEGYIRKSQTQSLSYLPNPNTLSPLNESFLRKNIVQTALTYLHTPYRWGGKTPVGIDCSGFCFMAYFLNGIIIWRDASIKEGYPVLPITRANLKPADLLYFPGHVALYLGAGQYIHASANEKNYEVVINSLRPKDHNYRADLAKSLTEIGSVFSSFF